jgi:hypothetical protein
MGAVPVMLAATGAHFSFCSSASSRQSSWAVPLPRSLSAFVPVRCRPFVPFVSCQTSAL